MKTVVLLVISNIFMTLAWYGHLKYKENPIWLVILASWGIAFFEYVFQVPANRIGAETFSVTQLKIIQEAITLVVFSVVAYLIFGETLKWNNVVSYVLIVAAVFFAFLDK
ncbi:MAG: DMT family protein [Pyrinomonadaceae bacterium]